MFKNNCTSNKNFRFYCCFTSVVTVVASILLYILRFRCWIQHSIAGKKRAEIVAFEKFISNGDLNAWMTFPTNNCHCFWEFQFFIFFPIFFHIRESKLNNCMRVCVNKVLLTANICWKFWLDSINNSTMLIFPPRKWQNSTCTSTSDHTLTAGQALYVQFTITKICKFYNTTPNRIQKINKFASKCNDCKWKFWVIAFDIGQQASLSWRECVSLTFTVNLSMNFRNDIAKIYTKFAPWTE